MSKEQSLVERLEGMLHMKQDDWIEACKQIELLERQLALCKSQRDHLIGAHLRSTDLPSGDVAKCAKLASETYNAELAALERTGK